MPRREAERLVHARGGHVVPRPRDGADMVVVGDDESELQRVVANDELFDEATRAALHARATELVRESDLWSRLGLIETVHGVERLYTPAMLADLLNVPIVAVRHWHRRGALRAAREVRKLPYFDFAEVGVARKLAQLLAAGCGLSAIHRRLAQLDRMLPRSPRPLAEPTVVVEGRRLLVRRGDNLAEPTGQLLIDFDAVDAESGGMAEQALPVAVRFTACEVLQHGIPVESGQAHLDSLESLRSLATELESTDRREQAVEVYRAILFSGTATAEDHFALAELLFHSGDLTAARERYYMAIELDEDFVEARANLGCVLADLDDVELAEAAFRGALEFHPDYADAHYHLARLLDRTDRSAAAAPHWQAFLDLAPASPWADEAYQRMTEGMLR